MWKWMCYVEYHGKFMNQLHGTFNYKDHVTVKLMTDVDIPEMYPQLKVIQKSILVDSSPKLTHDDWIKEQSEDSDINLIIQLLKSDKLKKYVATEMDSSGRQVLLKYS